MSKKMTQGENIADIEVDNAQWDALLATDKSQNLLEKMAAEALAEHQASRTRPINFDQKGKIIPG